MKCTFDITEDNPVSRELVDKYPLPDGYFWVEGTPQKWPAVRRKASEDSGLLVLSYRYVPSTRCATGYLWSTQDGVYPVESAEDAVRLAQALILFGEVSCNMPCGLMR